MSLRDEVRKFVQTAQDGDRPVEEVLEELDAAKDEINLWIDVLEVGFEDGDDGEDFEEIDLDNDDWDENPVRSLG